MSTAEMEKKIGHGPALSPLDSAFLYFERPNTLLHVGCLARLDGPITHEELVELSRQRLATVERYRQRPVRPPLDLGPPHWEADPDFDVRRHIRHVGVPPPGGPAELRELADALFTAPLDARHPLWENVLIDGLADGSSAVLMKVHHCMIDGISGAQILERMTDDEPQPFVSTSGASEARPAPSHPPEGGLSSFVQGLRGLASPSHLLSHARDLSEVLQTMAAVVRDPAAALPFNGPLSDRRQLVWMTFPLEDFFAMRGAAGCKVNDVVLAVIAGALHRYLEGIGFATAKLSARAVVPVSARRSEDRSLGNQVVSMLPRLPIGIDDPAATLALIAEEMRGLKERGQARAAGLALGLAGMLPSALGALAGRFLPESQLLFNTICTNVPGPRGVRKLLGRSLVELCPFVPLFQGMGLEFAILSYGDRVTIGATCDPHLVPEPGRIAAALAEAHEALRNALRVERAPSGGEPVTAGLRVADLMTRQVMTAQPWDSLAEALEIMRRGRFRHLPIVADDGRLAGILTHRDLLAAQASSLGSTSAEEREAYLSSYLCAEAMETHLDTANPDELVRDAARRMIDHKIGCLPVLESDGRLAGILTEEDFLRWVARGESDDLHSVDRVRA